VGLISLVPLPHHSLLPPSVPFFSHPHRFPHPLQRFAGSTLDLVGTLVHKRATMEFAEGVADGKGGATAAAAAVQGGPRSI
jgi:hypothetical protein